MDVEEIKKRLEAGLEACQVSFESDGNKIALHLVSDSFEGLSKVKRQQKVYAILNDWIVSGEVHAVTMTTITKTESSLGQ